MTDVWPDIPYEDWKDTCATLHLWTQIVGKIRLSLTPWLNHSWHVPLYVTSRGLTTSPIPYHDRSFEIEFDFNRHLLSMTASDGGRQDIALQPRTVAEFYNLVTRALGALRIKIAIEQLPCEIPQAIPFSKDNTHGTYDPAAARRFWLALVQVDRVFKLFRTGFIGKCSPVHFFWGSFDMAVTRFSGRAAPLYQGNVPGLEAAIMQEAYSHEVSSAGFWPGNGGLGTPAFYSYAYPVPDGFKDGKVKPAEAKFDGALGEFLLPYDVVRTAKDPDATLLSFLQSTYEAAANSAKWDRQALEAPLGSPCTPRKVG